MAYIIVNTIEKDKINFDEFQENCFNVSRTNFDGSRFILEYGETTPTTLTSLDTFEGPFNEDEMLLHISSSEWIFEVETNEDFVEPECS